MPGINGMGLTFNLPNFNGVLYQLSPTETPFTSAIGVMSGGGEPLAAKDFEWQAYDLRDPENPDHQEGQDAPDARHRVKTNIHNVAQIFHSTVELSYTKQAADAQRAGLNNHQPTDQADEMTFQVNAELMALKRDIEYTFIRGEYAKPADNELPRKTRGILEATETNVIDHTAAPTPLTEDDVLDLMQMTWDNGGIQADEGRTIMVNSSVKRQLTKIFITDKGYSEESRTLAGVRVQTIETDFGVLNIMLNRWMPTTTLSLVSLEMCKPRLLLIPGKGFLFLEALAKTGASDKSQIYGEIGLEYGSELQHGKIVGIDVS